jgi:hypothetical protein
VSITSTGLGGPVRNGLPRPGGYVYRGTGEDWLTGHRTHRAISAEIAAAEGAGYIRPLMSNSARPAQLRSLDAKDPECGRELRTGYCGLPAGHRSRCRSAGYLARDSRRRTAAKQAARQS